MTDPLPINQPPPRGPVWDPRRGATYGICDAARSTKRSADRTSIGIFTCGPGQKVFLLDWVLDQMDPGQRADALVRLVKKWRPIRFVYEEIAMASDTFYLNERFQRENIDLRLIPIGRNDLKGAKGVKGVSKHDRIVQLTEWFREGRIVLPRKLLYTQVDGKTVDLIYYFIHDEYLLYRGPNTTRRDDALDMFSRLLDPQLRLEFIERGDEEEEEDHEYAAGGSWEGVYG